MHLLYIVFQPGNNSGVTEIYCEGELLYREEFAVTDKNLERTFLKELSKVLENHPFKQDDDLVILANELIVKHAEIVFYENGSVPYAKQWMKVMQQLKFFKLFPRFHSGSKYLNH